MASENFIRLKRQTTNPTWKLRELADRRVFDDLLGILRLGANHKAVFVSGTTPNDLNELCERAARSKTLSAFQSQLNESAALRAEFEAHFLPQCGHDWNAAWSDLQRLRVGGTSTIDGRMGDSTILNSGRSPSCPLRNSRAIPARRIGCLTKSWQKPGKLKWDPRLAADGCDLKCRSIPGLLFLLRLITC
jgi:hypothetical protein